MVPVSEAPPNTAVVAGFRRSVLARTAQEPCREAIEGRTVFIVSGLERASTGCVARLAECLVDDEVGQCPRRWTGRSARLSRRPMAGLP